MSDVPFFDLAEQHRGLRAELLEAFAGVLDSGAFCLGPEVARFESEFAAYHGVSQAVAVNTGTSALHLALTALDIGPGDEVITTPATFVASAAAIRYCGARPVYADILPAYHTLDPEAVRAAITPRTRAILPVHLYGQCCRMEELGQIAAEHGLAVIEDACQAHGATHRGRSAGAWGRAAAFSFYPSKNLGACGEGGILVGDDSAFFDRVRRLRDWGQSQKYHHDELGFNYRMDGLQAAALRVKLRHLSDWTQKRQKLALHYAQLLSGAPLEIPQVDPGNQHVYHLYPILVENRDKIRQSLLEHGVHCGIHYPVPVHLQVGYADPAFPAGSFPIAEALAARTLSLPMYPELSLQQQERVAQILAQTLSGCGKS